MGGKPRSRPVALRRFLPTAGSLSKFSHRLSVSPTRVCSMKALPSRLASESPGKGEKSAAEGSIGTRYAQGIAHALPAPSSLAT